MPKEADFILHSWRINSCFNVLSSYLRKLYENRTEKKLYNIFTNTMMLWLGVALNKNTAPNIALSINVLCADQLTYEQAVKRIVLYLDCVMFVRLSMIWNVVSMLRLIFSSADRLAHYRIYLYSVAEKTIILWKLLDLCSVFLDNCSLSQPIK